MLWTHQNKNKGAAPVPRVSPPPPPPPIAKTPAPTAEQQPTATPTPQPAPDDEEDKEKPKLKYVTYTKLNPTTGQMYAGRTSGYGDPRQILRDRDVGHHKNKEGFGPARLDKVAPATLPRPLRHSDPAYQAIRGREQQLIDFYGGAWSDTGGKNSPALRRTGNENRGVDKRDPRGRTYHAAATTLFKEEKHGYTGY